MLSLGGAVESEPAFYPIHVSADTRDGAFVTKAVTLLCDQLMGDAVKLFIAESKRRRKANVIQSLYRRILPDGSFSCLSAST
jgi:hypothetical protein